jgi:hypothetical protein
METVQNCYSYVTYNVLVTKGVGAEKVKQLNK